MGWALGDAELALGAAFGKSSLPDFRNWKALLCFLVQAFCLTDFCLGALSSGSHLNGSSNDTFSLKKQPNKSSLKIDVSDGLNSWSEQLLHGTTSVRLACKWHLQVVLPRCRSRIL